METRIVVGIGELVWDIFGDTQKLGGAPANFAYHAAAQGFESYVITAVGNDKLADKAISQLVLRACHVMAPVVDFPTGQVIVTKDDSGVPSYDICNPSAWDHIPFSDELARLASRTSAVCFGTLAQRSEESHKTIISFLDSMPEGSLKVFDANLRGDYYSKDILESSLRRCNILKISEDEISIISKILGLSPHPLTATAQVSEYFDISTILLTSGARGSLVITHSGFSSMAAKDVKVFDTVGAGDSFTAAYVTSILKGYDFIQAHKTAVELSSFVCCCEGAMPVIPDELKF